MKIDTIFISDVHLGSKHSKSEELLNFLSKLHKVSNPKKIYIIGDFIDGWALQRGWYWKNNFTMVIRKLFSCVEAGTEIIYIVGNHDEFLKVLCKGGVSFGNIKITTQDSFITKDGKKLLIIHGDQFDSVNKYAKWLSILGTIGYELLLHANNITNFTRDQLGLSHFSLSRKIRHGVKQAVKYLSDFENCLSDYALTNGYDGVICGHIHYPESKTINGICYYNTGDWVENCSAIVEKSDGQLQIINLADINLDNLVS